jgi:arabinose-5-phosphate isomerase
MSAKPHSETPADLVRIEAAALEALAQRLDGPMHDDFDTVCSILVDAAQNNHRVVLAGVGKSGLIARKIAATLVSTGTPAQFLHPAEALHGDIGILARGDVLLALSYSGETEELVRLLPAVQRIGATLISFCGSSTSTLAQASVVAMDVSVSREACSLQLAPTASTTVMLALGDALAIEVSRTLGFAAHDFADLHPGGQLGRRLSSVGKLMHSGDALPQVAPTATMPEIIHEMSAKRLGMTTVQNDGKLLGIISDGDLRRLFERDGPEAFHKTATEVMNAKPLTISPNPLAPDALLLMEQRKITALVVTEDGTQHSAVQGVLHIHDLWEVAPRGEAAPTAG